MASTYAIRMLVSGPAIATMAKPRWGWLKKRGCTGIGLAQPNRNVPPEAIHEIANIAEPSGSTWRAGFGDRRPSMRAVGSPRRLATYPCAISCSTMETTKIGSRNASSSRFAAEKAESILPNISRRVP